MHNRPGSKDVARHSTEGQGPVVPHSRDATAALWRPCPSYLRFLYCVSTGNDAIINQYWRLQIYQSSYLRTDRFVTFCTEPGGVRFAYV